MEFGELPISSKVAYGVLIFTTIFGFTSIMDGHQWAFVFEITRSLIGLLFMLHPFKRGLWEVDFLLAAGITTYFLLAFLATLWMYRSLPKRIPVSA